MSSAAFTKTSAPAEVVNNKRRNGLLILGAVILIAAIGYGLYWFLDARFFESTDDAYVAGNVVAVTSRENATVMSLHADNTQTVKRGQLLIEMDPAVAQVNMAAAEANLARAVRAVRGEFSSADSFSAQLAEAEVALAQAQNDYQRRQSASAGAVSGEELAHAKSAVAAAETQVTAAEGGLAHARSQVEGTNVAGNPDVMAAEAQLRNTAIALGHMRLVAPVDGVIAQRTVQVGQQVAAGTPLMAVVPLSDVWIDANFKEVQLSDMRIGQPVTITADLYGGGVTYHGHIEGLGAGSGSAFALLPPQNASGNWIKIVQRVPVRIALDPKELADHPLRVGLSVAVNADVRDTSGPLVTSMMSGGSMTADTGENTDAATDALIAKILADNGAGQQGARK
ncbi:MAG TPA: HlyD family efflux transporter periplasmic adaptor subunit [Rhizomicrobium sp.]|jgi:membrane fusion protein (multidrug efflux system)|nr:HlyD family efflux transporter periplasmic adaptor subunit [Rhizomicrobium sp.]